MKNFYRWLAENEAQILEGFTVHQNMMEIPPGELTTEYNEEIAPELETGKNVMIRWGLNLQEAREIFGDLNHFLQIAKMAKPQVLPPSILKNVRNYGQVTGIIKAFERNPTIPTAAIQKQQGDFFGKLGLNKDNNQQSDPEKQRQLQGGYTKKDSYKHKVGLVANNEAIIYPLMLHHNNEYSHISGHTRQTGAVSNKMILPVKVIEA